MAPKQEDTKGTQTAATFEMAQNRNTEDEGHGLQMSSVTGCVPNMQAASTAGEEVNQR